MTKNPTRKELHQYLGKNVTITFYDSSIKEGILSISKDIGPNIYQVCETYRFRVSHIKSIRSKSSDN